MTTKEIFLKWAEDKDEEYIHGFLDGLSQSFKSMFEIYKNSVSNDTE